MTDCKIRPNLAVRLRWHTLIHAPACWLGVWLLCIFAYPGSVIAQTSSLALAGLRSVAGQGRFNAIRSDAASNLYLLLDQGDGIRLLKADPTASTVLAQTHIGSAGDGGLALALDPAGNVYVTGTSTSGSLTGTPGTVFPSAAGSSTNSFVAGFDPSLKPVWLTFTGTGMIAADSIAATANGIFITGSVFSTTLPVTPFAILQAPAAGSFQNGFVEAFSPDGKTLLYATYLTGANGDTAPADLVVDSTGNAYVTGYTTAPGYPTLNALIPNLVPATVDSTAATTSGFLTKISPAGDGLIFSTFIPGNGLTSIALDPATQNLLLTGDISVGQFPIATVQTPIVRAHYQTLLRLPLDGSTVLASTFMAPGTHSTVAPGPGSTAWVISDLTLPVLPIASLSILGDTFAAHINAQGSVGQIARFGGLATAKPAFITTALALNSLVVDASGQPTLVGAITSEASSSLRAVAAYDLPLYDTPNALLPSTIRDTVPATCNGSLCGGSAAYLARLADGTVPSLAVSADAAPNITLRNLGTGEVGSLTIVSSSFTVATNCPSSLAMGAECSVALTGAGPGSITIQGSNAAPQTIAIPALTATQTGVVFSPTELDFGIQTASSAPATQMVTVSNLTNQPQTFVSEQDTSSHSLPYTLAESASDCTVTGPNTKLLAPGATCHITLSLTASSVQADDTLVHAYWLLGPLGSGRDVLVTGYTQAASLSLSASEIDFGTLYTSGIRLPRYLYLSNSSDATIDHSLVASIPPFTIQDRCPTQLSPHTVCQIEIDYLPTQLPSDDSATLALDRGLSALLTGQALPQPGVNGATANPNLSVSTGFVNFPNAVVVTTVSSATRTVTITNTGGTAFSLSLALTGDFSDATNCLAILSANSSCAVVLSFSPSQPGTRQGLLSITAGAGSTPVYVRLAGTGASILPPNNETLDLGSIIVGEPKVQWFKITQPFSTFTATTGSDFASVLIEDTGYGHGQPPTSAFSSTASGSCLNCWLGLQFKPSAPGLRTAGLTLTSTPSGDPYRLNLTGTGLSQAGLVLTPIVADFGTVPLHSTSTPTLLTLTNLTANSITVASPVIPADFVLSSAPTGGAACGGVLASSATCFLQVAFSPSVLGQRSGALTLTTSAGLASTPLKGFAAPDSGLALSPNGLIFQNVPGSISTVQTISVTNTGANPVQIATPIVTNLNFVPSTDCATLAPAATCSITVVFSPSTATIAATLRIPTNSAVSYTIPLAGAYTLADMGLQIIPTEADFGPTPTGSLGQTRQFAINNLTAKSLALNITLPRQFALEGPPCSGLAPNASCSFNVTFVPLTNGDVTGTLFAQANPADGSQAGSQTLDAIGNLEGYGTGASTLKISGPLSTGNLLNFGQVASGQTTAHTLTLTNTGDATSPALTIRRITTEWPFLSTSTCGATLAASQSCTVTITYNPLNQIATGSANSPASADAGVLILESDSVSSPDLINLSGTAAPVVVDVPANAAQLITYAASRNSLRFPSTAIGDLSVSQTVTLSNTGTATIRILSVKVPVDFKVTNACGTLVPGTSCELTVYFAPQNQSNGIGTATRIGALEILSDSSSSLDFISLVGSASPSLLTLSPTSLDFGTVLLGNTSTLPVQVTNTGANAIQLNNLSTTGDYTTSAGSCPLSGNGLSSAASCTVQVAFTPTQTGTRTGAISLVTSGSSPPLTASLTGIGGQSHLQVIPATLSFGTIAVGASAALSLTLTNTGNAPLTGISLGTSAGDFVLTVPCTLSVLVPGASCLVTVTFTPAAVGPRSATLTITSSDIAAPDLVPLTGTGISNGTFSLAVDGGSISSTTVTSGQPATYNLTLTSINHFAGSVALTCTPINPADFATCSFGTSSISLNGGSQGTVATIETVTSVKLTRNTLPPLLGNRHERLGGVMLSLLTPILLLLRRRRSSVPFLTRLGNTMLIAGTLGALLTTNGCGGGGDPALRYSTPGTYQYLITASSTSGIQVTQSVTLNLTIKPR